MGDHPWQTITLLSKAFIPHRNEVAQVVSTIKVHPEILDDLKDALMGKLRHSRDFRVRQDGGSPSLIEWEEQWLIGDPDLHRGFIENNPLRPLDW